MKGRFGKIFVTILGLTAAVVILDVFCWWYYNPLAYLHEDTRATDTVRQANTFTSRATEGFGQAVTDANGYNNAAVPEDIFVLMMGSSQMEGFNVMQNETAASWLGALLPENGVEGCVYNIGMSSHTLTRNIANLDRALERFKPEGYVVLEAHDVAISKWEIDKALSDKFGRRKATSVPLPDIISERPLLRTLYNQYMTLTGGGETAGDNRRLKASVIDAYNEAILELMQHVADVAEKHGVTAVFLYHPHLVLQEDGTAITQTDPNCLNAFAMACEAAGVVFVDMTQDFMDAYAQSYTMPHGYSNTMPGAGHLNKTGHEMIARALCREIVGLEADK